MKRITLLCHLNAFTGYGQHAIEIVRGLELLAGAHVAVRTISKSEQFCKLPADILSKVVSAVQPEEWEILLHPPNFSPTPLKRTAFFTMHESTRLHRASIPMLNQAAVVIVPSSWNASTFSACGVKAPIRIVPLGIDPAVFSPMEPPREIKDLCVFGAAGRTFSGGTRKGIVSAIEAFTLAFPNQKDVRLKLKCLPDDIPAVDDPRIEITSTFLSNRELAVWLSGIHCFVSAAKAEGWGLFQQQAMAVGRPVVSVKYGGVAEFFDDSCGYPVDFTLEHATDKYLGQGHWAEPTRASLIEQMRMVYNDRSEAMWRGRFAAERARAFSWERSNLKLLDVLHEFGAMQKPRVRSTIKPKVKSHAVFVYLPPPGVGHSEIFLKNLAEHPPAGDLVILSDHPWPGAVRIPDPTKFCKSSNSIASFVFLHALEYAERRGLECFVWLESDCRVNGRGWDMRIVESWSQQGEGAIGGGNLAMFGTVPQSEFDQQLQTHIRSRYVMDYASKSFADTAVLIHGKPEDPVAPYVNGAPAVFSVENLRALIGDVDIHTALEMLPIQDLSLGQLAVKRYGLNNCLAKWIHMPMLMGTAGETIYPFPVRVAALKTKRCAAVHPIKNRWRPPPEDGYSFYSSGNLGDIVYALKAIRVLGGGRIVLGPQHDVTHPPQHPITKDVFALLAPLLKAQAWIEDVAFSDKWVACSYDLDDLRALWHGRQKRAINYDNLCQMLHYVVGAEQLFDGEPWLTAASKPISRVIIHRSPRAQSCNDMWPQVMNLCPDAVFIGLPEEHAAFEKDFGRVPFYKVRDFGEMAEIINGAEWYVGNESFPLSIALGLGKNVYQETWFLDAPNCLFKRPNIYNQRTPVHIIRHPQ